MAATAIAAAMQDMEHTAEWPVALLMVAPIAADSAAAVWVADSAAAAVAADSAAVAVVADSAVAAVVADSAAVAVVADSAVAAAVVAVTGKRSYPPRNGSSASAGEPFFYWFEERPRKSASNAPYASA
jgi:hypothetical protein